MHVGFGGGLKTPSEVAVADRARLDIVGIYPGYAEAYRAWKAAARRSVDNPQLRYFSVHISRRLDPTPRHLEPGTP
ncbi:MAG: DUF4170 domain-containing protein [Hyphomicrobiaceae bacterium]